MRRVERGARESRPGIVRGLEVIGIGVANIFLVLFGCGVDKDHLPGLPNHESNPIRGSSSTGATGGAGGPSSVCECAAGIYAGGNAKCGDCVIGIIAPGQPCANAWTACGAISACGQIISCAGKCKDLGGGDVTGCINQCILPLDPVDAHQKFAALLECACGACSACTYAEAISCPTGEGDAGDTDGDTDAADATADAADAADAVDEGG
jgi:hypothetical protein